MSVIIAHKGEIIARDFMTSYPSGEPAWKPGIEIPEGAVIGMQWTGDITPYIALVSWIGGAHCQKGLHLVLPFLPCSRQDKTGPVDGDQSEGVNYIIALLLTAIEAESLTTLDNHSQHPIDHWRDLAKNLPLSSVVTKAMFPNIDVVIAPDKGARIRAEQVACGIDAREVFCAEKLRDQASGKILTLQLEIAAQEISPSRILVVDDIIDGGRTFKLLAQELQRVWPDVPRVLLCTHGVFPSFDKRFAHQMPGVPLWRDEYTQIVTTDSCKNAVKGWNVNEIIPVVERLTIERSLR